MLIRQYLFSISFASINFKLSIGLMNRAVASLEGAPELASPPMLFSLDLSHCFQIKRVHDSSPITNRVSQLARPVSAHTFFAFWSMKANLLFWSL